MSVFDLFANEQRWIAWRNEKRGGKLTKVPYGAGGKPAKANDPATWLTRTEATVLAKRIANGLGGGVGLELGDLGADLYIVGFDLDSCIDENRCLALWAEKILTELDTYAETSPSGTGVKAFFYIPVEHVRPFLKLIGVNPDQWGTRRGVGEDGRDHGPAVELYCALRYFAITDQLWPGKPAHIATLDWEQLQRLAALIPNPQKDEPGRDNSRSAKAFREGARLRREGKSFEEMCDALRNHADAEIRGWVREKGNRIGQRELRRIWDRAAPSEGVCGVSINDFYAYMPMHNYIFTPARTPWPGSSVNSRIRPKKVTDAKGAPVIGEDGKQVVLSASAWLDRFKPVEQMTWAPGLPMIIEDKLIIEGGWIDRAGVRCLNLYLPPSIIAGDTDKADPWLEHIRYVFPEDAEHILDWLAHRVQYPDEKINHALVLGGKQGIGKDSILEPVKAAVGPWNFQEVSPNQVLGRFNGFLKSVILRVSEARDLGEFDRFQLYDHMKAYTAAPPDVLRVDEKHLREHSIVNCCGVIITTNHKTDGIYLPADDRRHFVAWSDRTKEDDRFQGNYWDDLWSYYENGGRGHVSAFLLQRDISKFNPKAPPPRTPAFWAIADANRAPEDAELADVIEALRDPEAVILLDLILKATEEQRHEFADWLRERKHRRLIPHRLEACGYVPVRNPTATDGLWKIAGRRQAVYAKSTLSLRDQIEAAHMLTE